MAAMLPRPIRPRPPAVLAMFVVPAALGATLLLGGCGETGATGSPGAPATGESSAPSATAPASETSPTTTQGPAATPPTTTDTDWGRIWDAVPADFPVPEAAKPTEANEAVSAAWSLGGRPAKIADGMVARLEAAGWSIEAASGPLEDGSQVIDAVRGAPECRAQVTVAPRGSEILVMVRYAAACPWE